MLNRFCRLVGIAALIAVVLPSVFAEAKSPATVIKPKRSAEVAGLHEFIGKLSMPGYPIVLVRSEVDHQWWVQPQPQVDRRGFFKTEVTFGNEETAAETKFHVVVVVVDTLEQSNMLVDGVTLKQIPNSARRSIEQIYTYRRTTEEDKQTGILTSLKESQAVPRRVELAGNWQGDGVPLVAVRTESPKGLWWIQSHPKIDDAGKLSGVAHFGNQKTAAGTKFRIAIFSIKSEKERESFAPGTTSEILPGEDSLVETFVVEATGSSATEVKPSVVVPVESNDSAQKKTPVIEAAVRLPAVMLPGGK